MQFTVAALGGLTAAFLERERIREDGITLLGGAVHIHRQPLLTDIRVQVGGVAAAPARIVRYALLRALVDAYLLTVALDDLIIGELLKVMGIGVKGRL